MNNNAKNALCALAATALVAGVGCGLYFGNSSVNSWLDGNPVGDSSKAGSTSVETVTGSGALKLGASGSMLGPKLAASTDAYVHNSIEYTASVYGFVGTTRVVATNHKVAWSVAWTDTSNTAAVGDYVKISSTADTSTGGTMVLSFVKAFAGTVTVSGVNSEGVSASLAVNCYQSVTSFTVSLSDTSLWSSSKDRTHRYDVADPLVDGVHTPVLKDYEVDNEVWSGSDCLVRNGTLALCSLNLATDGGGSPSFGSVDWSASSKDYSLEDMNTAGKSPVVCQTQAQACALRDQFSLPWGSSIDIMSGQCVASGNVYHLNFYLRMNSSDPSFIFSFSGLKIDGISPSSSQRLGLYVPASSVGLSGGTTI